MAAVMTWGRFGAPYPLSPPRVDGTGGKEPEHGPDRDTGSACLPLANPQPPLCTVTAGSPQNPPPLSPPARGQASSLQQLWKESLDRAVMEGMAPK